MNREMFKSVTLVSLFILCIVLTGQLMLSLSTIQQDTTVSALAINKTFDIKEVFSPQSFVISFGGGIYTQNYTEENSPLWKDTQVELMVYFQNPRSLESIEGIDESRWVELVKSRAVRFEMPFQMTLSDMQTLLDLENSQIELNQKFDTILVSTHDRSSIFFGNESDSVYYRMKGPEWSKEISERITAIENSDPIEYRRLEDLFGLQKEGQEKINNTILPIMIMRVDFVKITPEVDINSDESVLKSYANKAFGKQFNFVKKMRDVDDSIIYLYGYANKAFRLGADGSIEFTQRLKPGLKMDSVDLRQAMQMAIGFIDQFGGAPASLYLANYETEADENGNLKYTIDFDYRIKELPILTDVNKNEHSVRVEIVGDQVTNFSRSIQRFKDTFMLDLYPRGLTINEVLERNSNTIQSNYEENLPEGTLLSSDDIWTRILSDITDVELAYHMEPDKPYMSPVWKLDIGNMSYAFRLYDGRLLKSQVN